MSREYCGYCDQDFISGRACRKVTERDKCAEWAMHRMAECDYWNGRKSLSDETTKNISD